MQKPTFEEFIKASMCKAVEDMTPKNQERYKQLAREVWEESTPEKVHELMKEMKWWGEQRAMRLAVVEGP